MGAQQQQAIAQLLALQTSYDAMSVTSTSTAVCCFVCL